MKPPSLSPNAHRRLLVLFFRRGLILVRRPDRAWGLYRPSNRTWYRIGAQGAYDELLKRGFIQVNEVAHISDFRASSCAIYELTAAAYFYLSSQQYAPHSLISEQLKHRDDHRGRYSLEQAQTLFRLAKEARDTTSVYLAMAFERLHHSVWGGYIGQKKRSKRWRFIYDDHNRPTVALRAKTFQALLDSGLIERSARPQHDEDYDDYDRDDDIGPNYNNWHELTEAGKSLAWDVHRGHVDPHDQRIEAIREFQELIAWHIEEGVPQAQDDFSPRERALYWTALTLEQESDPQVQHALRAQLSTLRAVVGKFVGSDIADVICELARMHGQQPGRHKPS